MSIWASWFLASILFNIAYCLIFIHLTNQKNMTLSCKMLINSLVFAFLESFIIIYGTQGLRIIFILFFMFILFKINFNIETSKLIVCTFIIYLFFAIAEVLYAFICFYTLHLDVIIVQNSFLGIIITNIVILVIVFAMLHISYIGSKISNIIKWYSEKSIFVLVTIIAYSILSIFVLMSFVSNNLIANNTFVICIVFIISIIIFIFIALKENADKNKLYSEYDYLMKYVDNYAKVIDEKSKEMHEYKNQLIILRDLITGKNQKAKNYIAEILKTKFESSKYSQLSCIGNIPLHGIRGLLYYKVNEMIEKGIEVYLNIVVKTSTGRIWNLCNQNLKDLSRVMGVYIDNAIQACLLAEKKYIIIELNENKGSISFCISNTYRGNIDIDNMDKEGFTTKGRGHGYGLALTRDILEKNKYLSHEREINGIYYVQKLIIDNKNKS